MSELKAKFILNEQEPIKSKFVINSTPNKLSQLENDMGYITADNIPEIDTSELATKEELNQKQDKITDLETIRANASKGATAVQPDQLATVATSGSYNDLTDIPESGGGETYTAGNGLNLINNNFELLQQDFGVKGVEVVGNLTEVDNVYSGFTNSNYLVIPSQLILNPEDDFEIQFKFNSGTLSSSSTVTRYIYNCATYFKMYIKNTDYLYIVLPTYSSGSYGYLFRDYLVANTIYTINIKRIVHSGSYTHLIKISTDDGESWTELVNKEITGNEDKVTGSETITVGNTFTSGLIYLDKSFIKVNGEDWWNPLNDTFRPVARATESLYGLVKPDNNTITINDGVISTALTDVQVNGTSVLSEGIANIPIAAAGNKLGLVFPAGFGVNVTASGALAVVKATDALINAKANNFQPVVPSNLDYAVKVGVTTNTKELTGEEKTNACNWLGAGHQRTTVIDSTAPTIVLDKALANTDYQYGTITSLSITEIENSYLETNIFFTAGTEITVDLPDTLKIIGNLSFEAEKQYIMSICNNTLIAGVVS